MLYIYLKHFENKYKSGKKDPWHITSSQEELCLNADCTPMRLFLHQSLLLFMIGNNHSNEFPFKDSKDIYISQTLADVQGQIRKRVLAVKKLIVYKSKNTC